MRKLGSALLAARASREAAARLEEAVRLSVAAKSQLEVLHSRGGFGLALAQLGRFDDADRELREAIEKSGSSIRARHLATRNLGTLRRLQGRYAESPQLLEKATAESAIQRSHRGDHAHGLVEAGLTKLELGDSAAARDLFGRAAPLFSDVHKQRMTPHAPICWWGWREYSCSTRSTTRRCDRRRAPIASGGTSIRTIGSAGDAAFWLGRSCQALGRHAEALDAFGRAQRVLARSPLPADARLRQLARAR